MRMRFSSLVCMAGRPKAEMYISLKLNILMGMNNIALKNVFFYSVSSILFPPHAGRNRRYSDRLYSGRLYSDRLYLDRLYSDQLYL